MKILTVGLLLSLVVLLGCHPNESEYQAPPIEIRETQSRPKNSDKSPTNTMVAMPIRILGIAGLDQKRFFTIRPVTGGFQTLIVSIPETLTNNSIGYFQLGLADKDRMVIIAVDTPANAQVKKRAKRSDSSNECTILAQGFGQVVCVNDDDQDTFSVDPQSVTNRTPDIYGLAVFWKGDIKPGDLVTCEIGPVDIGKSGKPDKYIRATIEKASKPAKNKARFDYKLL